MRDTLAWYVETEVPDQVIGDPVRLTQIIVNLVGNALKFTERGGIALRVEVERDEELRQTLRFEVADTGVGMPPEVCERIFDYLSGYRSPVYTPEIVAAC